MLALDSFKRILMVAMLSGAVLATTACSKVPAKTSTSAEDSYDDNDPIEPFNRVIFEFNRVVDMLILHPITVVYQAIVPSKGREMVSNAVENAFTPVVLANSMLQGDVQNSFASFWRFAINTTVGIGGLFDVAADAGLQNRQTDFGQTLAYYGADSGAYIVLPIMGPSSVRDAFGRAGDIAMNPVTYMDRGVAISVAAISAVDARSTNAKIIDDIFATSLDPYATFRSAFLQKRQADISRMNKQRSAKSPTLAKAK